MRVVLYDRTCVVRGGGLSPIWATGARLYHTLGRVDAVRGVASWREAFAWLAAQREPVSEIQYWGHGKWGSARVGDDVLDARTIPELAGVREVLAPGALVWFRTCETLGADAGHDFAQRLADFLGARIAGHTHIIAYHQSGLHGVAPGVRPDWPAEEGLVEGTAAAPVRARKSARAAPRTITCMTPAVPPAWFAS